LLATVISQPLYAVLVLPIDVYFDEDNIFSQTLFLFHTKKPHIIETARI
jgi:hypothetical protein